MSINMSLWGRAMSVHNEVVARNHHGSCMILLLGLAKRPGRSLCHGSCGLLSNC